MMFHHLTFVYSDIIPCINQASKKGRYRFNRTYAIGQRVTMSKGWQDNKKEREYKMHSGAGISWQKQSRNIFKIISGDQFQHIIIIYIIASGNIKTNPFYPMFINSFLMTSWITMNIILLLQFYHCVLKCIFDNILHLDADIFMLT